MFCNQTITMEYNHYDDFALTNKSKNGGGGDSKILNVKSRKRNQENRNQQPDGKYNSKHVRIQQEKQNKSKAKKLGVKNTPNNQKKSNKKYSKK